MTFITLVFQLTPELRGLSLVFADFTFCDKPPAVYEKFARRKYFFRHSPPRGFMEVMYAVQFARCRSDRKSAHGKTYEGIGCTVMSETKPEKKVSSDFSYCFHLVAFLDLLGQRQRLCEIEGILGDESTPADLNKLVSVLKETVGTIWNFRKDFSDFYEQYAHLKPTKNIPKEIETQFNQLRGHSKINFQSFSDSTIAWTPIQLRTDLDYAHVLNSIYCVFAAVGMITSIYLRRGAPFRGGIDIEGGISIVPGGNEIYGPVLNRAYALENKAAKYPRVVLGKGIREFFEYVSSAPIKDQLIKNYCALMIHRCESWITEDDDGLPMIHFLGPAALELVQDFPEGSNYYRDILEPVGIFIRECESRFSENEELRVRYKCLRTYFDRHINAWRK